MLMTLLFTGEEVSIDKQVACEECPRWLKMTEVACEKTEVACEKTEVAVC